MSKQFKTFYRYFPVTKRDRDWGLYVTVAGAARYRPRASYPPLGHSKEYSSLIVGRSLPEYQVLYISAGSGWIKAAGKSRQKIEAGHALLLFPGVRHSYAPCSETGWTEHWVRFDGDFGWRLVRNNFFKQHKPVLLRITDERRLYALFSNIIETAHKNRPALQQFLAATTMQMLALLYSDMQSKPE